VLNLGVTHFLADAANDRAYRRRRERMIQGDHLLGECDAGSPGSDGASPYLRRACPRQPATHLNADGVNRGI
jgi:hypothetical protein